MALAIDDGIEVEVAASTLAFRAGQFVERRLLEAAAGFARESGSAVITEEHVSQRVGPALIDQLAEWIKEDSDGESVGDRGADSGASWQAA